MMEKSREVYRYRELVEAANQHGGFLKSIPERVAKNSALRPKQAIPAMPLYALRGSFFNEQSGWHRGKNLSSHGHIMGIEGFYLI
ncbi:MAG TPA: hypothetical protein DEA47_00120 [Peptococcaceae bacterium]|nr:MAG: hypothetical protein XD50_0333 [Clostridia bacterium 41_269]HBT19780.1 hypothetical protein [Peptococcaceae bacterium]